MGDDLCTKVEKGDVGTKKYNYFKDLNQQIRHN